jgi:tetratricopeptide (TPR) repeat protein
MELSHQSATGVPGPQRRNSRYFFRRLWPARRALRGFSTTAFGVWLTLSTLHSAHAQTAPEVVPATSAAAAVSRDGWSRRLARSHFERALELERRGDIAQALREYTEAIAIDSTLGDAYSHLGALRERLGDTREAELVYSEAVRLGDTRAQALLDRSHLLRAAGRSALALRDLEASVELEASREALAELARQYVEIQAWSAALATLRRIANSPAANDDPTLHETTRLEIRALRILAAETDPSTQHAKKHDWVARALISIARR